MPKCAFLIIRNYFQGLFPPGQGATIGVDFMIKTVEIDGERVKVNNIFNFFDMSYMKAHVLSTIKLDTC